MLVACCLILGLLGWQGETAGKADVAPAKSTEPAAAKVEAKPAEPKTPAKIESKPAAPATETKNEPPPAPFAFRPYKVQIWLGISNHPRLHESVQQRIREEVEALSDQCYGQSWNFSVIQPPKDAVDRPLPTLEQMRVWAPNEDKVIWLQIRVGGPGRLPNVFAISAREFDFDFNHWGPLATREIFAAEVLPETTFDLVRRQFRATMAVQGGEGPDKITTTIRAQGLQPKNSPHPLATPGTPFRMYRDFFNKQKQRVRTLADWSYLVLRETFEINTRSEVFSVFRVPISKRAKGKTSLVGIACGTWEGANTTIRFVTGSKDQQRPVTGFEVMVRPQDRDAEVRVGTTDHRGRITIRPVALSSDPSPETDLPRVYHVVMKNGPAVMTNFPIVPGEQTNAVFSVKVDPLITECNGRNFAIQEEIVDVVARRMILEKVMEFHNNKEDVAKVARVAEQLNALPDRKYFEKKIEEIETNLTERATAMGKTSFGPAIRRMFLQSKNLLENDRLNSGTVKVETTTEKKKGS